MVGTLENSGTIDVSSGLLLDYTGESPVAYIRAQVAHARNDGAWDRPGITSVAARDAHPRVQTLGVLEGSDFRSIYGPGATFFTFPVDETSVLVRHTLYGDTDFNGVINFDDYGRTDAGFLNSGSTWFAGDFNFDGVVNFDDYALIDFAFLTQSGTLRPALLYLGGDEGQDMSHPSLQLVRIHYAQFGQGYANNLLNAIPEPACLGMLAAACAAILRRHRD